MQSRRDFFRTMIGGVAAAAAVRTWPYRVFSFPTNLVTSRQDLGFSVLDYSGMPIIEDEGVPTGRIFLVRLAPQFENGYRKELRVGKGVEVKGAVGLIRSIGIPSGNRNALAGIFGNQIVGPFSCEK